MVTVLIANITLVNIRHINYKSNLSILPKYYGTKVSSSHIFQLYVFTHLYRCFHLFNTLYSRTFILCSVILSGVPKGRQRGAVAHGCHVLGAPISSTDGFFWFLSFSLVYIFQVEKRPMHELLVSLFLIFHAICDCK